MAKLWSPLKDMVSFECPGCGYGHAVTVNGRPNECGASWGWNGSMDVPTFTPSILVNGGSPESRCHSFVRDGQIQFLPDCFHVLKGKTVALPEVED